MQHGEGDVILQADARQIPLRDKRVTLDARMIEGVRQVPTCFHRGGYNGRSDSRSDMSSTFRNSKFRRLTLEFAQSQTIQRLTPFDAQVGQKSFENQDRSFIRNSPSEQFTTARSMGFRLPQFSAEDFHKDIKSLRRYLANVDALAIRGLRTVAHNSHRVSVTFDSYGAIRVDDASEISKV